MLRNHGAQSIIRGKTDTDHTYKCVDLMLPQEKIPTNYIEFTKKCQLPHKIVRDHFPGYKIGSSSDEECIYECQLGLFECVKEAWGNHWNLRTSPEDWWLPVASKIAKTIDEAAKPNRCSSEKVRELFVSHEGKQNIAIEIPVFQLEEVDPSNLFSLFSTKIEKLLRVPKFATAMLNDFSTTTNTHMIASQINLMASAQQFFTYQFLALGCGIKGLEMLGKQTDWDRLLVKLREVKQELEPILSYLDLPDSWFTKVEYVYTNLAKSYSNPGSDAVASFWADVLCVDIRFKYGPSGNNKRRQVVEYNGWLVEFLTGCESLRAEHIKIKVTRDKLDGLNRVPMQVTLTYCKPVVSYPTTLVAGILGFTVINEGETFNQVPSVKPHHMWALLYNEKS